jgi:hypothetical protein
MAVFFFIKISDEDPEDALDDFEIEGVERDEGG